MAARAFEVLYGPVDQPVDEWKVHHTFNYDDEKPKAVTLWDGNVPPEMIQEFYVRRENWIIDYRAKNFPEKYPATHRWIMRQVPEDQDYIRRSEKNGWDIWELSYHPYNLARLSADKTEVTYYANEKDARLDRPKTIKAISYLRSVRCISDESDIAYYCDRYGIPYADNWEIRFATTREEIRNVYVNGPRSCMSGEQDMRYYGVHPTEAYACAPIAVAYMVSKDDPDHIAARTVVNMETKEWVCTYGARYQFERLLRENGYSQSSYCIQGYKLLNIRVELENSYRGSAIQPYYDFYHERSRTSSDDKYVLIDMTEEQYQAQIAANPETC